MTIKGCQRLTLLVVIADQQSGRFGRMVVSQPSHNRAIDTGELLGACLGRWREMGPNLEQCDATQRLLDSEVP